MARRKPTRKPTPRRKPPRQGNRRTEPLWDLYRDGITASMLSKFFICRERFRLNAVEGWSDKRLATALEFGSCFHDCHENHAAGYPISTEKLLSQFEKNRIQARNMDHEERAEIAEICGTVGVLFPRYVEHWREMDQSFEYVAQEEKFEVPYTLPSGRVLKLRGRIDAAYREGDQIWILETKTKGDIDEELLTATLQQDLQTMFYVLAFSLAHQVVPGGVLYNVIRRPGLRRRKEETLPDFLQRIGEDIDRRPEWYFMRWKTELEEGDLDKWIKRSLDPVLEQLCLWWESISHNPFDPWTDAQGQPNLHHYQRPFGVYDGLGRGGRGDYFELLAYRSYRSLRQRDVAFPELEAD